MSPHVAHMTLWRLEVVRLIRTRRWLALVGVYVFFGLLGPISARYLPEIIGFAGGLDGAQVQFPAPVPADGMAQFSSNASQIGTLVTVVVSAGALAFDAVPEMGVFLRTRVGSMWTILVPRLVVAFAAAGIAWLLGVTAAWYETWALIGPLPAGAVLAGALLGLLFLAFVIALVAAAAQLTRGVLASVMLSVLVLLLMPVVGIAEAIGRWMPTHLATALAGLAAGEGVGEYLRAAAVAAVATAALVLLAIRGARRREL